MVIPLNEHNPLTCLMFLDYMCCFSLLLIGSDIVVLEEVYSFRNSLPCCSQLRPRSLTVFSLILGSWVYLTPLFSPLFYKNGFHLDFL